MAGQHIRPRQDIFKLRQLIAERKEQYKAGCISINSMSVLLYLRLTTVHGLGNSRHALR